MRAPATSPDSPAAAAADAVAEAVEASAPGAAAAPPLRGRAKVIAMAQAKAAAPAAAAYGEPPEGPSPTPAKAPGTPECPETQAPRIDPELLTPAGTLAGKLLPLVSLGSDEGLLEDELAAFIEECCSSSGSSSSSSGSELVVVGCTGTLVGRYTKRPICLPVASPCLLTSDTSQLLFEEALPQEKQQDLLQQLLQLLLGGERRAYTATQLPSSILIADTLKQQGGGPAATGNPGRPTQREIPDQDGTLEEADPLGSRVLIYSMGNHQQRLVRVAQQVLLGRKLIYRPRASRHLQVSCLSESAHYLTPLSSSTSSSSSCERGGGELPPGLLRDLQRFGFVGDTPETMAATPASEGAAGENLQVRVTERKVVRCESWKFAFPQQQQQQQLLLPEWVVELRREVEEGDTSSHPELLLLQLQQAAADTNSGLGADADLQDESRRVYVRLYAPSRCLLQQQQKQQEGGYPSFFAALVSLFLHNLQVAIATPLEDPASRVGSSFYFPGAIGDNQQAVQSFYEARKVQSAAESPITALRLHTNQVSPGSRVLDLACGHGQDLLKFAEARVSRLLGIDFSRESILEARRRVRERSSDRLLQQLLTKPEYHVGNALEEKAWGFAQNEIFDVVSLQLSIHYMVSSEEQAGDLLARCASRLSKEGKLIGSTMCCREIVKNILELKLLQQPPDPEDGDEFTAVALTRLEKAQGRDVYWTGNRVFALFFSQETLTSIIQPFRLPTAEENARGLHLRECFPPEEVSQLALHLLKTLTRRFGIRYHFWLRSAIDAEEFVFPFDAVRELASKLNLQCCLSVSFPRLLEAATNDARQGQDVRAWVRGLRNKTGATLDDAQARIFGLYKAFAFVKTEKKDHAEANASSG